MMDLVALWVGRVVLALSGLSLATYLLSLGTKFIWREVDAHAEFLSWILYREQFREWLELRDRAQDEDEAHELGG